jgi:hypothetical protein
MNQRRCWSTLAIMQPVIHTAPEPPREKACSDADRMAERAAEHTCTWCPNCSAKLESSRCKLVCRQCGYYMSCADYY